MFIPNISIAFYIIPQYVSTCFCVIAFILNANCLCVGHSACAFGRAVCISFSCSFTNKASAFYDSYVLSPSNKKLGKHRSYCFNPKYASFIPIGPCLGASICFLYISAVICASLLFAPKKSQTARCKL